MLDAMEAAEAQYDAQKKPGMTRTPSLPVPLGRAHPMDSPQGTPHEQCQEGAQQIHRRMLLHAAWTSHCFNALTCVPAGSKGLLLHVADPTRLNGMIEDALNGSSAVPAWQTHCRMSLHAT